MSVVRAPRLTWTSSADRAALAAGGHEIVEFSSLRSRTAAVARRSQDRRRSVDNPARAWLDRVSAAGRLAVVGVQLHDLDDLRALHGYVLEPALRSPTSLVVESEQRLTRLEPQRFVDAGFDYPYTLERALHAATQLHRGADPSRGGACAVPSLQTGAARVPAAPDASGSRATLDAEQRGAVDAHDGVVQVIAPAGSGKTTVLIERARELIRRGTAAERILCTTFNRDARQELRERLARAGLSAVTARTFHSVGWWLMQEEGLARRDGVRAVSLNQWRGLCGEAWREAGEWVEPADAAGAIAQIKLGLLLTPAQYRAQAAEHEHGAALARIYELYERQLVEQDCNDYDDLVLVSVRALRGDAELRKRWQGRFEHVLVDEYQDIEPAQELLVRILAAPQDGLFCVGDEDQTLYGWRRASVRRMIDLDRAYPGLERVSLAHNYRCPAQVVEASRRLIEHNRIRFPKPIDAAPDRAGTADALTLREHEDRDDAAAQVALALAERRRGETVVLARTTSLLRTVALACAQLRVRVSAPEAVFESRGALGAIEAYVRLCEGPRTARPDDVAQVCRAPNRSLPPDAAAPVARSLQAGLSFNQSLRAVPAEAWRRARLSDAGLILDVLASMDDAARFVAHLRAAGGLDEYFSEYERTFGGAEAVETEALVDAQREAAGLTLAEYGQLLAERAEALRAVRDDTDGIELTTIHRAKGRQWPQVHVFACEESQLPHARSFEASPEQRAAGEGLEAERRLAYVAFTRAQNELVVHATRKAASRFLSEAGLDPSASWVAAHERAGAASVAGKRVRTPGRPCAAGGSREGPAGARTAGASRAGEQPVSAILAAAHRVGLGYALRTAPTRARALEIAASAIEQRAVGTATASARMSVAELMQALEQLTEAERELIRDKAAITDGGQLVARLGDGGRSRLAAALREVSGNTQDARSTSRAAPR